MKEPGSDIRLWQDKMLQLPLEGDEQDMWQNMQDLLDENMPVDPSGSGPASPKNSPGAGTIISVIVIIVAIVILLLYFTGAFQPGKQRKTENKINKVNANSVNVAANNSNNSTDKKDVTAKNPATNNTTSSKNKTGNKANEDSVTGQKNTPSNGNNSGANAAGGASTVVTNGNHADKLRGHYIDSKKSGSGNNSVNSRVNNTGGHSINHSLVSGNQTSLNAYLQTTASKNKTSHYFGRKNKPSGYKKNAGTDANYHAPKGNQHGGNNNTDSTASALPKSPDTIASLITSNQQAVRNGLLSSNKPDSTTTTPTLVAATNNAANKQAAQNKATDKNKVTKDGKASNKPAKKQSGNSKFELDLRLGINAGSGSSTYAGINAGYYFTPKLGVLIGADVMPSRTLSGSYIKSNLEYTVDTGKLGKRETGKIIINGSRKFYTIDVPVTAVYKINKMISIYGGPVLSVPVKANTAKNNLTLPANATDTAKNVVAPYLSSTVIDNKFSFGLSAGARLNFKRLFISAGYMQDAQTYTISSALGSGKISRYHAVQFGIGFQLFKPTSTKP
jgi:hypothetical protein